MGWMFRRPPPAAGNSIDTSMKRRREHLHPSFRFRLDLLPEGIPPVTPRAGAGRPTGRLSHLRARLCLKRIATALKPTEERFIRHSRSTKDTLEPDLLHVQW